MYYYSKPNDKFKIFLAVTFTVVLTYLGTKYIPTLVSAQNHNNIERLNYSLDENIIKNDDELIVLSVPEIIKNSVSSIVGISVLEPNDTGILDIDMTRKWGIGTGVIVSSKGYILTNQHLATKVNSKVNVTLENGSSIHGKIIWNEPNIDLAIIKVDKTNLPSIQLGDSDILQIGEEVIAIGNPLGLEFQRSVTKGIISGLNRTLKIEDNISSVVMEDLIQTDASINTGNSGGPLINSNGEVIGINTVKITDAEGIGFAVPINIIKPILNKLETEDNFSEAYLGLYGYDKEIIPYINSRIQNINGIYVADITKGSPADKSDIKVGDIITKIDNLEISKMSELRKYLYTKYPFEIVRLLIIRNGKEIETNVTLTNK